jgi:hypothetical protein
MYCHWCNNPVFIPRPKNFVRGERTAETFDRFFTKFSVTCTTCHVVYEFEISVDVRQCRLNR